MKAWIKRQTGASLFFNEQRTLAMLKKILQEPLLHFLLIGAGLFVAYAAVNPDAGGDKRIVVDDGRINNLMAVFEKTWNRQPTRKELKSLVDDYVLEEIYYREALKMGIDKNDAMIRRRLRQKMEFFASAATSMVEPDSAELQQYLEEHADKYQTDSRYSFEQVYISTDRSQTELEKVLNRTQQLLKQDEGADGDATLLPKSLNSVTAFEVERNFGSGFSKLLDEQPLGVWSEPLQSGLGLHFVKLNTRDAGELPPLQQVRDAVVRDWMYDKTQTLRADLERKLLNEYEVVIDLPTKSDSKIASSESTKEKI